MDITIIYVIISKRRFVMNDNTFAQELTGIWYINNNMACRKNKDTNKITLLPITEEILEQMNNRKDFIRSSYPVKSVRNREKDK